MLIHYSITHKNKEAFPQQDLMSGEERRVWRYSSNQVPIRQGLDKA